MFCWAALRVSLVVLASTSSLASSICYPEPTTRFYAQASQHPLQAKLPASKAVAQLYLRGGNDDEKPGKDMEGKVVVLTGGTAGIGVGLLRECVKHGVPHDK